MAQEPYRAPRGTEDLLPEKVRIYRKLEEEARRILEVHGYREIRTPFFEETRLFVRSIGEVTDIVEKEMFTVSRGGESSYSFRPEGTASVVRAYLEHNFHKRRPFQKFFYIGPMFRYEKPQKGRQRQFWQIGAEALGSSDPRLDAEMILLVLDFFERLGLRGLEARINSIGDKADRDRFREVLKEWFRPKLDDLCPLCRDRYNRNVFRILDCKVETCKELRRGVPEFLDHLSPESLAHFEAVKKTLDMLEVPYRVDPSIVRGFDYYTHTVFEIPYEKLGARSALCGGGRYDDLIAELGGPSLGAVGFSIGVTPTLIALEMEGLLEEVSPGGRPDAFLVPIGPEQEDEGFRLAVNLRRAGFAVLFDHQGKGLRARLKLAARERCRAALLLGEEERKRGVVKVRDLDRGEEMDVPAGPELEARLLSLREEARAGSEEGAP